MVICRHISQLLTKNIVDFKRTLVLGSNLKQLNYTSKEYTLQNDPSPYFLNKNVQELLWGLCRVNMQKVFRKRKLENKLEDIQIEFLTDSQLQLKMKEMEDKAKHLLQIPPIVPIRTPRYKIYSEDPALKGLETANFVFTDITFGVKNAERLIVVRDTDGTLKEADWSLRDRINQVYFPMKHREIKIPKLFDEENLENILNRQEYEYILDRACLQFDPNDPKFQKVVSITYQHLNDLSAFDKLRSTRHFGGLVFFLVWNKMMDNLLLDLIETCHLEEAKQLTQVYELLHNVKLTNEEMVPSIEEFIKSYCNKKADLELAMQATKDVLKNKQIVDEGIKKAHGQT